MKNLRAILRGVCPRCQQGKIFQRFFRMNHDCPICSLLFEREPGYFLGAMYISYFLSVIYCAVVFVLLRARTHQDSSFLLIETALLYLPFVLPVFRYSRILWIYIDRT